ncbi:MAG: hypothetical protein AVDCRST_MAG67-299, partial [uncultured Solirubrobacteraceae bacterium]
WSPASASWRRCRAWRCIGATTRCVRGNARRRVRAA